MEKEFTAEDQALLDRLTKKHKKMKSAVKCELSESGSSDKVQEVKVHKNKQK